jgi:F0F1-type ATP synthase gamma subunit
MRAGEEKFRDVDARAPRWTAREKLDEQLTGLQSLERRLRQEQITDGLLEIVTGTDAAG